MSSTLKSARTASSQRKRNPSKSSPSKVDESDPAVWKLQALLQHLPDPCPKLEVNRQENCNSMKYSIFSYLFRQSELLGRAPFLKFSYAKMEKGKLPSSI